MTHRNRRFMATFVFILSSSLASAQSDGDSLSEPHYAAAIADAMLCNGVIFSFNRFVTQKDYGYVTLDSIKTNVTNKWVWDQNTFSVNHWGHPYQGGYYFNAGRANGLSFWQSTLLTIGGSVTWELFCETERPSINDLIVTTMGGVATGEILHRLYNEAAGQGSHLAFLISPMDAFNNMKFKTLGVSPAPKEQIGCIQSASLYFSVGSILSFVSLTGLSDNTAVQRYPIILGSGLEIVYGAPFLAKRNKPYDHFEMRIQTDISQEYYSASIFSDGLISRFGTWNNRTNSVLFGLSLHYDVLFSKEINYSGNAVDFTCKAEFDLPRDFLFSLKAHLGALLLGSSDFYYLREGVQYTTDKEQRDYDFGTGIHSKLFLTLSHPRLGSLAVYYMYSGLDTIKPSIPDNGSHGFSQIGMLGISYEHRIKDVYWLGVSMTAYHKQGFYDNAPDLSHRVLFSSIYVKKEL